MAGLNYSDESDLKGASGLASDTTGDKTTIAIPYRCDLNRSYVVFEGGSTHATAAIIKFDVVPASGGTRTDGTAGVLKKTASVSMLGKYVYSKPTSRVTLKPGDLVVVEVTTANGNALTFSAGLVVERVPESLTNEGGAAATA